MKNKLETVPKGKEFVLSSGAKITSINELYKVLHKIDKKTFNHHVTKDKNDFADWIRGVQGDYVLANSLNPLMSKESCIEVVANHMYELKKESENNNSVSHVKKIQESNYIEDSLEMLVSNIKTEVNRTLLLPEGGNDLLKFAEEDIIKDSLKEKTKKAKEFVDFPGFKKDMKKVFSRKQKDNKPEIDDLKRVCINDEE